MHRGSPPQASPWRDQPWQALPTACRHFLANWRNHVLAEEARRDGSIRLIRITNALTPRGALHVGNLSFHHVNSKDTGKGVKDCWHYCGPSDVSEFLATAVLNSIAQEAQRTR